LICATNFIRALDDAFLRHGRFDYVIPIGLPDSDARAAIWAKFIPGISADQIDVDVLVDKSAGFSPADIEYAARRASQSAFESAMLAEGTKTSSESGPSMTDYVSAIEQTKTTVSAEVIKAFTEDIANLARV
jgi:SpoVK/Ycf46/Vps4 family AAA+-type ATPase